MYFPWQAPTDQSINSHYHNPHYEEKHLFANDSSNAKYWIEKNPIIHLTSTLLINYKEIVGGREDLSASLNSG